MTPHITVSINTEEQGWTESYPSIAEDIKNIVLRSLQHLHIDQYIPYTETSVLLTNDTIIQELNKKYRSKDKPTNVLSFPYLECNPGDMPSLPGDTVVTLGDIILSFDTIKREAAVQSISFQHHVLHLAVHGTLHLLGYTHVKDNDAAIMEGLETEILALEDIPSPYDR